MVQYRDDAMNLCSHFFTFPGLLESLDSLEQNPNNDLFKNAIRLIIKQSLQTLQHTHFKT